MRGKSYVIVSLGFIISISVIIWMLFKIDFQTLGRAFRQFRWEWIPLLVFVYLAGFFVRGFRWQIMLHPLKTISWLTSTSVILIGYMANNVLPARIGEIVRAYTIGEKERMSKISALSSIIERIPPYQGWLLNVDICGMAQVYPEDGNMNNCVKNAFRYVSCL